MAEFVGIRPGGAPSTISGLAANHTETAYLPDAPNWTHKSGLMTMIFRVLSRKTSAILKEHRLMCMPHRHETVPESRSSIHYTAGGVYFDSLGILGPVRHSIHGVTLLHGQNLPTGVVVDGMASFKDLDSTIKLYFTGNAVKPVISGHDPNDLMLVFIDEQCPVSAEAPDPVEWIAHPHDNLVTCQQDAKQPFLYPYTFNFIAVPRDVRSELRAASLRSSVRPRTRSLLQELQSGLNQMASLDALVSGVLTAILGPQAATFIETAQRYQSSVRTVVTQFAQFASGLNSLVDSTFERVNSIIADGESLRSSIVSIVDLTQGGTITGEHAYMLTEILTMRRRMNALLLFAQGYGWAQSARAKAYMEKRGSTSGLQRGTSRVAEALGRTNVPVKAAVNSGAAEVSPLAEITLQEGDTLDSLAGRAGVDIALLLAINNLRYPYVDTTQLRPSSDPIDELGRNVVYRGEAFLVPGAVPNVAGLENQILLPPENTTDASGAAFTLEERLFGSDLAFDFEAGDLVLDPATQDLGTKKGLDNYLQSIDMGFNIRLGELRNFPAWGSYLEQEVGTSLTRPSRERLTSGARKTLLLNPRTAAVNYLKATGGAGRMDVQYGVTAIGGSRLIEGTVDSVGGG